MTDRIRDPATWLTFAHGALLAAIEADVFPSPRAVKLAVLGLGLINLAGMLFFDRVLGRAPVRPLVETAGDLARVQTMDAPTKEKP